MVYNKPKQKGIILFIVLGTILLVIVMANVILTVIVSQNRLTHHQVSRVQAYYAAQAGMNLAIEKLRLNDANWTPSPGVPVIRNICRSSACSGFTSGIDIEDPSFPISITRIMIIISIPSPNTNPHVVPYRISVTADYTPS